MRQAWAILLDSVDLVQAQNCQVDLTHALDIESHVVRDRERTGWPSIVLGCSWGTIVSCRCWGREGLPKSISANIAIFKVMPRSKFYKFRSQRERHNASRSRLKPSFA